MSENMESMWEGDVLNRTSIGRFLYRFLLKKYESQKVKNNAGAISFALDGGWGTGKTFFVANWCKEILANEHPVVFFDAWKNDLSEEPLLGFIAELKQQIEPWENKIPPGERMSKGIREIAAQAGRALIPTATLIGKGLLKKAIGVGADELLTLVSAESFKSGSVDSATDNAFDQLFESSINEHNNQMRLVGELKKSLSSMLTELEAKAHVNLPLFIFVDELDRCRPPYAIKLLEGIKHVFDAKNICFCFSINTEQLAESIRAVYGNGFDSHLYLKRFFDFEYSLPPPASTDIGYCKQICSSSSLVDNVTLVTGMHDWQKYQNQRNNKDTNIEAAAQVIAYASRAFKLDLRSQTQVFAITEAAASGIAKNDFVHLLYLFSLSCIYFRDRKSFDKFLAGQFDDTAITKLIDSASKQTYPHYSREGHKSFREVGLIEVIKKYAELSTQDLKTLINRDNGDSYPGNLADTLIVGIRGGYSSHQAYPAPTRDYPRLIAMAGNIAENK